LWFYNFDISVNTWGVCGTTEVTYEKESVAYCHWAHADSYRFEFVDKHLALKGEYAEYKIFEYLYAIEETMRYKAIELARGSKQVPWGLALLRALKENAHIWAEQLPLLGKSHSEKRSTPPPPKPFKTPKLWGAAGKFAKGRQGGNAGGKAPAGKFCDYFNRTGECKFGDDCKHGRHACSKCNKPGHGEAYCRSGKGGGKAKGGKRGGKRRP